MREDKLVRRDGESDGSFQRRVAAVAGAQDVDARLAAHEVFGRCLDDFARHVARAASGGWRRRVGGSLHLLEDCRCPPALRRRLADAQERQAEAEAAADAARVEAARLEALLNACRSVRLDGVERRLLVSADEAWAALEAAGVKTQVVCGQRRALDPRGDGYLYLKMVFDDRGAWPEAREGALGHLSKAFVVQVRALLKSLVLGAAMMDEAAASASGG